MARRIKDVTISTPGRDQGKMFRITEMEADKGEEWGMRALMALTKAGVELPEGATGMAGIASAGLEALGKLQFAEVKLLMDEMFLCIERLPDPKNLSVVRPLVKDDTEEIRTRMMLRAEVWTLHTGFSFPGLPSTDSSSGTQAAEGPSLKPRTSRRHSRRLSPRG
jgi:hypothetical protein